MNKDEKHINIGETCHETLPCQHLVWYGDDKEKGRLILGHHIERLLRERKLTHLPIYKHFKEYRDFCSKTFYS